MTEAMQCIDCKHYLGAWECDAYSLGIFEQIRTGNHDHTQPYPGDQGIRFEPIDDEQDDQ